MANRKRGKAPYNPRKEVILSDPLDDFIRAPITGNLSEVPGLGEYAVRELAKGDEPINNTLQLLGKFLTLSPDTPDCVEHCNRFKCWLQNKNIGNGVLNTVVEAIAVKTDTMLPGIYEG